MCLLCLTPEARVNGTDADSTHALQEDGVESAKPFLSSNSDEIPDLLGPKKVSLGRKIGLGTM